MMLHKKENIKFVHNLIVDDDVAFGMNVDVVRSFKLLERLVQFGRATRESNYTGDVDRFMERYLSPLFYWADAEQVPNCPDGRVGAFDLPALEEICGEPLQITREQIVEICKKYGSIKGVLDSTGRLKCDTHDLGWW